MFFFCPPKNLPIMSDTEKVPVADNISNSEEVDQIVDPDAGLSEAERAANVSLWLLGLIKAS